MKKIAVLMASYNGEKFIDKQIKTILNQDKVKIQLYIADDCSNDSTFEKIKNLKKKAKNIIVWKNKSKKKNAAQNFINLIKRVNFKEYDYIALSDQDDLWTRNKVYRAIKILNRKKITCYSSDVSTFYNNKKKIEYLKKSYPQKKYDFLFEGGGPGSTYIFEKNFALKIQKNLKKNFILSKQILFHDWYIYFFARINNYQWFIDEFSGLKYRQHGNNELGANIGLVSKVKRLRYVFKGYFFNQLKVFFQLNKSQKKNYSILFCKNKLKLFIFICKNFNNFRRKRSEQFVSFIILIMFVIRRKNFID